MRSWFTRLSGFNGWLGISALSTTFTSVATAPFWTLVQQSTGAPLSYALLLTPPASPFSAPGIPLSSVANPAAMAAAPPSTLFLGGLPPTSSDGPLQWSPSVSSSFPYFTLNAPSVCGEQISATSLLGVVDTSSTCLTLPPLVFNALISWLPVECLAGAGAALNLAYPVLCRYLYASTAQAAARSTPLPSLDFTLSAAAATAAADGDDHTAGPGWLHLPLARLIAPLSGLVVPGDVTATLEILNRLSGETPLTARQSGLQYTPWTASTPVLCLLPGSALMPTRAVFGAMAASAFHTQVQFSPSTTLPTAAVGMANRANAALTGLRQQCRPRVRCYGMQGTDYGVNVCYNPPCGDYFFMDFTTDRASCKLNAGFYAVIAVIFSVFVILEVAYLCCAEKLSHAVRRDAVAIGVPHRAALAAAGGEGDPAAAAAVVAAANPGIGPAPGSGPPAGAVGEAAAMSAAAAAAAAATSSAASVSAYSAPSAGRGAAPQGGNNASSSLSPSSQHQQQPGVRVRRRHG
jgi:hypothetical protein